MKIRTRLLTSAFISTALLASLAACEPNGGRTDAEIQELVKDFILDNPEIIVQSVEQGQIKAQQEAEMKAKEAIKGFTAQLNNDENTPFIGNADAKNVIVEFFDYNCGYCKRSVSTVMQAHEEIADLKIVFKELPILGPSSEQMSRAALVVHQKYPARYLDFHQALMEHKGARTPEAIEKIAKDLMIPEIDFKKETATKEIEEIVNANRKLAQDIGVRGTPAFIINGEFIPGAIDFPRIKSIIEK